MALFYECMLKCARKLLDTADIVREAMLRRLGVLHLSQIPLAAFHTTEASQSSNAAISIEQPNPSV